MKKPKLRVAFSHFGPDGPRNFGLLIRMDRVGVMLTFWKWYLDVEIK